MEAKCDWLTGEYTGRLVPDLGEPVPDINMSVSEPIHRFLVPWVAWEKWPREFEARDTFRGLSGKQPDLPEQLVWKPAGFCVLPDNTSWVAVPATRTDRQPSRGPDAGQQQTAS